MSNPALDSQVKTALRDEKTAEKFAEHIAELAAQIVNATFKFSQDVKSAYESIQKGDSAIGISTKSIKPSLPWVRSASLCMLSIDFLFLWIPGL